MPETIKTVGVLIIKNNQVLLVKHKQNASHINDVYGLPAGRVEDGESLKQAAVRELEEETGLVANKLEEYPSNEYSADIKRKDGTTKTFSITIFTCKEFEGTIKENEETKPEWIDLSDVSNLKLLPNIERIINEGGKTL